MTIVDAVIQTLKETGNEAIGVDDYGLIEQVADKLRPDHKCGRRWSRHPTLNWQQKILNALDKSPLFEKKYIGRRWGRPERSFYLKESKNVDS